MLSVVRRPKLIHSLYNFSVPACHQIKQMFSHSSECKTIKEMNEKLAASAQVLFNDIAAGKWKPDPTTTVDVLPGRRMQDSLCEAIIPIYTDQKLRKKYLTVFKSVRFGRLLEDMDSFAGWVCYNYVKGDPEKDLVGFYPPYSIVTASVDRIELRQGSIAGDADILMKGRVTWVGKSSMETTIHLLQDDKELVEAKFVMVAYTPPNVKKGIFNPLIITSPEEELLFKAGEKARLRRKEDLAASLLKVIPRGDEMKDIHHLFLGTLDNNDITSICSSATFRSCVLPPKSVWMSDTNLSGMHMSHLEENIYLDTVFGGFVMRQCYELAFINALTFAKSRPRLLAVDDIHFRVPVSLGSVLQFHSQVGYSCENKMQVKVHAEMVDHASGNRQITNIFHFTFAADEQVPTVIPRSYAEAMIYIDSRRHFHLNGQD